MSKKDILGRIERENGFTKMVDEVNTRRYHILTNKIELIMEHLGIEFYDVPLKLAELKLRKKK